MTIKISDDRELVAIEVSKDKAEKFWACSDFATCTVKMEDFLDELERHGLIVQRPKTDDHQAQGLLDLV
jgi:hypothetical protein